jgi:hypothetical protein
LSEDIQAIGWKAQVRLCQRYRRLAATGKPQPKVTTAIARELVWLCQGHRPSGVACDSRLIHPRH